jgi:hypothetical protein
MENNFMGPEAQAGEWAPLAPDEVKILLAELPLKWWIAGGWAIDLFLGRQTRPHGDTDVVIRRRDQEVVQEYLSGWDLHKAHQALLNPWPKGEFLGPGVNDIWCRRTPRSPWCLQVMLLDTVSDSWVFRRDPAITGPLETIGRVTSSGIPFLAPEIQLLYKAKANTVEKDEADFQAVCPLLDSEARDWLRQCLNRRFPGGHPWLDRLR